MNPLHSLNAKARAIIYWTGYVLGVVGGLVTSVVAIVAAASPDFSMPLWLVITQAILTVLVSQCNLLAGSNVTPDDENPRLAVMNEHDDFDISDLPTESIHGGTGRSVGLDDISVQGEPYRSSD